MFPIKTKLRIYCTRARGHFLTYKTSLACSDCVQISGVNVGEWHFVTEGMAYCSVCRSTVCEMECSHAVFWRMSWWYSTGCKAICV